MLFGFASLFLLLSFLLLCGGARGPISRPAMPDSNFIVLVLVPVLSLAIAIPVLRSASPPPPPGPVPSTSPLSSSPSLLVRIHRYELIFRIVLINLCPECLESPPTFFETSLLAVDFS